MIEAWGRSPLGLRPREAGPDAGCGRGLTFVAALSERRGWERASRLRMVAWAGLALCASPAGWNRQQNPHVKGTFRFGGQSGRYLRGGFSLIRLEPVNGRPRYPGMATRASGNAGAPGCAGALWSFIKLPFMIIAMVRHPGQLLRAEAATDTGVRARAGPEQLTTAEDPATVLAGLAGVKSRDTGFDLAMPVRGVIRAREAVDDARRAANPDVSAVRQVLADGLWRVFVLLLDERAAHRVRRLGESTVEDATVVAVARDQVAEQLRIRLACRGGRYEVAPDGTWIRGEPGEHGWLEDWTVRRSATAMTPPGGGIRNGRCPQCGAGLQVDADGSCAYCRALVLTGGKDWVVWSIEEGPW